MDVVIVVLMLAPIVFVFALTKLLAYSNANYTTPFARTEICECIAHAQRSFRVIHVSDFSKNDEKCFDLTFGR